MLDGFAYCKMIYENDIPVDFIYLQVNHTFEKITGLSDVVGKKVSDILPHLRQTNPEIFEIYGRVAQSGNPEFFETFIESPKLFLNLSVFSPEKNHFAVVFENIIDRKKSESTLREDENKFQTLFENLNDGVVLAYMGIVSEVNQQLVSMLGLPDKNRIVGHNILEFMTPASQEKVRENIINFHSQRDYETLLELDFIRSDGFVITVEKHVSRIYIHGKAHGLSVLRDITKRKRIDEDLRKSEERYRLVADFTYNWEYWQTPDGFLAYISPSCIRITGYSKEEFMQDPGLVSRLAHPDDPEQKANHFHLLPAPFDNDDYHEIDFPIITKSKEKRWISHICRRVFDANGQYLGRRVSNHDITERKRIETMLKERDAQLLQADKMASLGRIVSGVAHEINNPNNFIMLNAPLLYKAWESALPVIKSHAKETGDLFIGKMRFDDFSENVFPLINGIIDGSKRIQRIVSELKDYIRPDTVNECGQINFVKVIQSSISLMHNTITKHRAAFTASIGDGPVWIGGNLQRMEQVIINLLQNSCDALLPDGPRSIDLILDNSKENEILLYVKDSGCGIATQDLPHVTEPFFTTKRNCGGTGLGLSISNKIISDHNGQLLIDSEQGKGTTVTIILPRKGPHNDESRRSIKT